MASHKHYFEGINHVIEVSSQSGNFAKEVNRYIEDHGYKLLHIGTQTTPGPQDAPIHETVAILGKKLSEEEASRFKKTPEKFKSGKAPKKSVS